MGSVDIRSLDVSMLRTFEALMTERSVSRAAARLFLSQPAVSASLKRLREVFGDPLFTRSSHGVEPTARALALHPHVQAVMSELGRLLSAGQGFSVAESSRVFRIIGSDAMSLRVLPRLCAELSACGSAARILWDQGNYGAHERLLRGDADLGLLPSISMPRELTTERLYEDHYVAVTPRGVFPADFTMADFCTWPQVFLGYGSGVLEDLVDRAVAKAGARRHAQVAVGSFAQMAGLVAEGRHIAIFPSRTAARFAAQVDARPLPFALPTYEMVVCTHPRADADPGVQWLKTTVAQIVRDELARGP